MSVDIFEFVLNIARILEINTGVATLLPISLNIQDSLDVELGITRLLEISEEI